MTSQSSDGVFITLEGGEGSGKSTQAKLLMHHLHDRERAAILTRGPAGSRLGHLIKQLLDDESIDLEPLTELLLFEAAHAQNIAEVIQPALERGEVVICDRFTDSSLTYQGYGQGIDLAVVLSLNQAATGSLQPDLTIVLDLAAEKGLARAHARASAEIADRIGNRPLEFHKRVREGYLAMAQEEPERFFVIEADRPADEISKNIWERVRPLLASPNIQC